MAGPAEVALWQPLIAEASTRFGIPQTWIAQVIAAESAGRTMMDGRPIRSPAGAIGLMQLMPKTYAEMQRRYGFGTDPADPHDNILAGAAYLRAMYQAYGYPYLFAAYNAGPGRFDDFLLRHRPLPDATIAYLNQIVPANFSSQVVIQDSADKRQFFRIGEAGKPLSGEAALFVPLSGRPP
jgi:soluble lytic murein transglycosylase-like protein